MKVCTSLDELILQEFIRLNTRFVHELWQGMDNFEEFKIKFYDLLSDKWVKYEVLN